MGYVSDTAMQDSNWQPVPSQVRADSTMATVTDILVAHSPKNNDIDVSEKNIIGLVARKILNIYIFI